MNTSLIATIAGLTLALVIGFQNCGQSASPKSSASSPQASTKNVGQLSDLMSQINQKDLSCSQDSDCQAVSVGEKACGGPTSYVIASKLNADFEQVQALAQQITTEEHAANLASNSISTCDYMEPPKYSCVANLCSAAE